MQNTRITSIFHLVISSLCFLLVFTSCAAPEVNRTSWRSLVDNYQSTELLDEIVTASNVTITPIKVKGAEIIKDHNSPSANGLPELTTKNGGNFFYLKIVNNNDFKKEVLVSLRVKEGPKSSRSITDREFSWLLYPKATDWVPGKHAEEFVKILSVKFLDSN